MICELFGDWPGVNTTCEFQVDLAISPCKEHSEGLISVQYTLPSSFIFFPLVSIHIVLSKETQADLHKIIPNKQRVFKLFQTTNPSNIWPKLILDKLYKLVFFISV